MSGLARKDILSLSIAERIELVGDIWDSIAEVPEAVVLTDAQKAELDQRLQEALVGQFCEKLADGAYERALTRLVARELSPQAAVRALLNGAEG